MRRCSSPPLSPLLGWSLMRRRAFSCGQRDGHYSYTIIAIAACTKKGVGLVVACSNLAHTNRQQKSNFEIRTAELHKRRRCRWQTFPLASRCRQCLRSWTTTGTEIRCFARSNTPPFSAPEPWSRAYPSLPRGFPRSRPPSRARG